MGFAHKSDTLTSKSLRYPWIIELYALGLVLKPWRPSHQEPRPKRYDAPTSKSSDRSVLLTGFPTIQASQLVHVLSTDMDDLSRMPHFSLLL